MTVRELRGRLVGVDPNIEVVTGGSDHSYRGLCTASECKAEYYRPGADRKFSEYWSDADMCEGSTVVDVFLIT